MSFTSVTFALFLAAVFALHWSLRSPRGRNAALLVASYVFYAWWDWRFCGLMLATSLMDYGVGRGMQTAGNGPWRRRLLFLSLAGNLGALGLFKYFHFFAESLQSLAGAAGVHLDVGTLRLLLPAGISYYTFRTLSYTIDVYRGKLEATRDAIAYLVYVSFFPHLFAGPITRARDLLPRIEAPRRFDLEQAKDGCRQILWGFCKKVALADALSPVVDGYYASPGAWSGPQLAFATVCFALQVYIDFSAYSDIATGAARLFGLELMRNFAYPYFSQDLQEFWRRWHISLTSWFRDYVFYPLGGALRSPLRTAWNTMATFLLSGFWHGAAWTYVIWGGLHGLGLLPAPLQTGKRRIVRIDRPGGKSNLPSPGMLARMAGTFALVCLAWVFFRAATIGDAARILRRIGADLLRAPAYGAFLHDAVQLKLLLLATAAFVVTEWLARRHEHPLRAIAPWPLPLRWASYTALLWGALFLAPWSPGRFIYFKF